MLVPGEVMTTYPHPHRVLLLSSSFSYPNRRLFFPRARLFLDRIELTGWHPGKKHERVIPFDELAHIEWDLDASEATFHLGDGNRVCLRLPHLPHWKDSMEQRLLWSAPGRYRMAASTHHTTVRRDVPLQELITFASSMG